MLTIHEGGLRKPFGKEKLASLADFKGKTIRAPQSQVLAAGMAALGANVEPLPLPDVYQALQNGTVDGVEANLPLIYTSKWYEQAKFITANVNFWPFPTALVVNKTVYDGLTADQQTALTDAAAPLADTSLAIFTNTNPPVNYPQELGQLRRRVHRLDPGGSTPRSRALARARSASWLPRARPSSRTSSS